MKYIYQIILFALLFTTHVACSDDNGNETPESVLTLAVKSVDFQSEAAYKEIKVTTNVADWTAVTIEGKEWCTPTVNGQTLRISVLENEGKAVREGKVKVTAGSAVEEVTVKQLGEELAILVSPQMFTVKAIGETISFEVTTNVNQDDFEITYPEWITPAPKTRATDMVTTGYRYAVAGTKEDSERTGYITFKAKEGTPENKVGVVQKGLGNYEVNTLEGIVDDIKVPVASAKASSQQSGEEIERSYDGDKSTVYHSAWANSGEDYFPITLTYNFSEGADMDYLVYYPRTDGSSNGLFKEVEIRVKCTNTRTRTEDTWSEPFTVDFNGSASPKRVDFKIPCIGVTGVEFKVISGAGDGQGFASCAEMEFYKKNPDKFDYTTLFTDQTCSELKPGVTDEDIENCAYSFYKNIAYYLKAGKYPDEFRVQEYKAYPFPEPQKEINKIAHYYSLLDNPTGISVGAGDNLVVFVGDMHGQEISLKVQNLDKPGSDGFGGTTYLLSEGVNKLSILEKGLAYVMYHSPDYETLNPIKIHFASGEVNGYFDLSKHTEQDWTRLLAGAVDKHFDVIGKFAHLTYPTQKLRSQTKSGKALIEAYDRLVNAEMELLGLYKYDSKATPRLFKNRMYFNVMYNDSYMYSTHYHTAYVEGTMDEMCNENIFTTSSCWGPAHEVGHSNQTYPGVRWLGTTECTNNIMSEYVQTTIFNQNSRIQTEDMGDNYRNRYSKAWSLIIAAEASHAKFGDDSDVFCKLVPFWQLQLYFGKVLRRSPELTDHKGGFYPDLYEYVRTHEDEETPGEQQTEFAYIASKVSGYDLTDFFEKWGFLRPVDVTLDDYGTDRLQVTQQRIDAVKQRIRSLNLPTVPVALEYISDNTWQLYQNPDNNAVVKGTATRSGNKIAMTGWKNVVAYEVVDDSGKLIFVSSGELTPSSSAWFTLTSAWKDTYKVRAISVKGDRIDVAF